MIKRIHTIRDVSMKRNLQTFYDEHRHMINFIKRYQDKHPDMKTIEGMLKILNNEITNEQMINHKNELEKDFGKFFGYRK